MNKEQEEPKQELLPDFRISKDIFDFVTDLSDSNEEVTQKQLLEDYQPKVMKDILDGKIKPGKHEF